MKIVLLAGIILILATALVKGHEAAGGWQYPRDCCGDRECRPIACSTIIDRPDGSVSWTGLIFWKEQIRMSRDAACHVCIGYGEHTRLRYGHCIFLAPVM